MRISRLALVPLFVILLAFSAGMLLSTGGNSTDPPPAAAEQLAVPLPPAASESLAQPAGFSFPPGICDYVAYLHFVIISGLPHEPYISLDEFIYLTFVCFGPFGDDVHAAGAAVPVDVTAGGVGNFVDVSGSYDPTTGTFEGTGSGTVAGYPDISVELVLNFEGTGVTGTYTMGAADELPGGYPAVYDIDGELSSTPTPVVTGTPGPTITRPPTESPGPTATPEPGNTRLWGNLDCDGDGITSRDNQALLREVLDQPALSQTPPCDPIGTDVNIQVGDVVIIEPYTWGNLDCDEDGITSRDNQALLREVLDQPPLSQTEFCPDIDDEVGIIPLAN